MILSNFHTHTNFCDGNSGHEDMLRAAIEKNIKSLGFSSHSPVPFQAGSNMKFENMFTYIETIARLKELYNDKIQIYTGLEIDFISGLYGPANFKAFPLDYTIGSLHYVFNPVKNKYESFDNFADSFKTIIEEVFNNSFDDFLQFYYIGMMEMVTANAPDIVAHFDVCAKFNKNNTFFDENSTLYIELVNETIEAISNSDCMVEINTRRAYRGFDDCYYPREWIIKRMIEKNIRFVVNSDAHAPADIDMHLMDARKMLADFGCKYIYVLWNNKWQAEKIS